MASRAKPPKPKLRPSSSGSVAGSDDTLPLGMSHVPTSKTAADDDNDDDDDIYDDNDNDNDDSDNDQLPGQGAGEAAGADDRVPAFGVRRAAPALSRKRTFDADAKDSPAPLASSASFSDDQAEGGGLPATKRRAKAVNVGAAAAAAMDQPSGTSGPEFGVHPPLESSSSPRGVRVLFFFVFVFVFVFVHAFLVSRSLFLTLLV